MPSFPRARSALTFLQVAAQAMRDSGRRAERELAGDFRCEDPWGYETERGRQRFEREIGLISAAIPGPIDRALEIGCAEGHFTTLLAPRCTSLLAVDISVVALARARERCRGLPHVRFEQWDLRSDSIPGQFDLVVATSVLEYLKSPRALRVAREKLVAAARPGGSLLVGNVRQGPVIEQAWWTRIIPRGGVHVNAFVASHPDLEFFAEAGDGQYLEMLFVRRP